jgi:hypothetical protein
MVLISASFNLLELAGPVKAYARIAVQIDFVVCRRERVNGCVCQFFYPFYFWLKMLQL